MAERGYNNRTETMTTSVGWSGTPNGTPNHFGYLYVMLMLKSVFFVWSVFPSFTSCISNSLACPMIEC